MDDSLEDARHDVLADNTAQAVHKHLTKLFQEEARFRGRWIWELLQNARDASPPGGVRVQIIQEPDRIVFRHNGLPFTQKSIAHLIYHGSTKHDLSNAEAVGQFGTGFLTTHLISKLVTVKGQTIDGQEFKFTLDRRGDSTDELKRSMDGSWDDFKKSLSANAKHSQKTFTTEYDYPLMNNVADLVTEGITDLIKNAAYT
jgi:hypothetical protein